MYLYGGYDIRYDYLHRKAIQKMSVNKRPAAASKLPWFLNNLESYYAKEMEAWQLARLARCGYTDIVVDV